MLPAPQSREQTSPNPEHRPTALLETVSEVTKPLPPTDSPPQIEHQLFSTRKRHNPEPVPHHPSAHVTDSMLCLPQSGPAEAPTPSRTGVGGGAYGRE